MNCKPGVMVMLLMAPNPAHARHAGEIRIIDRRGSCAWLMVGIDHLQWSDRYLKVIDNPGDDATDETLLLKPAPSRKTEVA